MKASEILEKFRNIILSEDGEVIEKPQVEAAPATEPEAEVELAEQEVKTEAEVAEVELAEMPEDEASPEDVVEDIVEEDDKYATKEELAKGLAEMKAMYEAIIESMGSKEESMEVPQELSADDLAEAKEVEVELSTEEEVSVEPIAHSPEAEVAKSPLSLYAQRGKKTTVDSVFNKLFK